MSLVRLKRDGALATLILARPGMGNALVPELLEDLLAALAKLRADAGVQAVVLRAEGEAFSLGGDMRRFAREFDGDIEAYGAKLVELLNEAILALIDLPQPVLAVVHGHVTGGSLGLVLACDLVVMAQGAVFKSHYLSAGFAPDGGWTALLPRRIGFQRAASALLLNRSMRAEEALACGLITETVISEELETAAARVADRLLRAPANTLRSAKRLLWHDRAEIAAALEAERQAFVAAVAGARQGVSDFLASFSSYPDGHGGEHHNP